MWGQTRPGACARLFLGGATLQRLLVFFLLLHRAVIEIPHDWDFCATQLRLPLRDEVRVTASRHEPSGPNFRHGEQVDSLLRISSTHCRLVGKKNP